MASRLFFNGKLTSTPGVSSAVDDTAMSPRNAASGNDLAIVAMSDGGDPNKRLKFGSPLEAQRVILGGEGLEMVRDAFGPSAETGGPRTITFIRVGAPTQSTLTLKDASAADAIVLKSDIHGLPANQIKAKVEVGSDGGRTRKYTTQYGNLFFVVDNLKRDLLTVGYTGAAAAATVDVTNTTVTLKAGPSGALVTLATLSLDSFPTVQQLADRIAAEAGFTAVADAKAALLGTKNKMDGQTALDVKAGAKVLSGDLQAAIDWVNSSAEGLMTATRPVSASAVPAAMAFTYLTGGSYPVPTNQDWTDAIDKLELADVQWITVGSGSAAVHAALAAHCDLMSGAGQKERRAVVGADAGTDVDEVKPLARALNSDRVSLAWPAPYGFDIEGNPVLLHGYRMAAKVAGMAAGVNPGTPLTNKNVRVTGLEYEARIPADTDDLIQAGVLVVAPTERGIKVVRSISTWLGNDNFNRVEISTGAALDFTVRSLREALKVLPGAKGNPRVLGRAVAIATAVLRDLAREEPVGPGMLVGDAANPPFKNVKAELEGDILRVSCEVSPVIPVNFVTLSVTAVPYSGVLTSAGS